MTRLLRFAAEQHLPANYTWQDAPRSVEHVHARITAAGVPLTAFEFATYAAAVEALQAVESGDFPLRDSGFNTLGQVERWYGEVVQETHDLIEERAR
jgi:hypothetical protein